MRMSELFGTTLRESPLEARTPGHAFLLRAGFIRGARQGLSSYLPLARRSLTRIEGMVRREMAGAGGQEILLPAGVETARGLVHSEVRSWRQLPVTLFQIGLRSLESPCLEVLCAAAGLEERSSLFATLRSAFTAVLTQCEIPCLEAELTVSGGSMSAHFLGPVNTGGDDTARCACGYLAPWDVAELREPPAVASEAPAPCTRVATPGCTTIDQLCRFLGVSSTKIAKSVMLTARIAGGGMERFVIAVVRGDREVSRAKLMEALDADGLRPATDDEIRAAGAVPGYASAVGLSPKAIVVTDTAVARAVNLVAGANEEGFHLLNVNAPRDFTPSATSDIAQVKEGDLCPRCGSALERGHAVTLGRLREIAGAEDAAPRFQDRNGRESPVRLLRGELDLWRVLSCAAEAYNDEHGLLWPQSIAPFDVHLISLGGAGSEALQEAERLRLELEASGVEVLFDDRDERAGVKFADADLIGLPLRLTVSSRGLESGNVEIKPRNSTEKLAVPRAEAAARVAALSGKMYQQY
jgi:prolyl-tRNA synthetase